MPADITSFIGRRRELSVSHKLLSSSRLVTLTGVGGVGKTRLALQLARRVDRSFTDGVILVEFAPLHDETLIISQMTAALGLGEVRDDPLARICEYVGDKTMLIVLDNCEHLILGCAALAEQLLRAAPRLHILATSQHALGVEGEQLLVVPPLSIPDPRTQPAEAECAASDATQLFAARAKAVRPDFAITDDNAPAVVGICQALDGIPLAIELAAVQLRALTVHSLHERLDHRFQILTQGSRAALPRHQTLRATIEWSYDLCSPAERLLWARMAVFSGVNEFEAIEQICSGDGIEPHDILPLLAGLIDKSIVSRDYEAHPRYRLLETIKEFGNELLAASGQQETMRAKHFTFYRQLIQRARTEWFSPHQAAWMRRLYHDQPNIRTALDYALTSPGRGAEGLEAAASLYVFWMNIGAVREGSLWLTRFLATNPEPSTSRAKALHGNAFLLTMLGDLDGAVHLTDECRALGEKLDDPSVLGYAAMQTGTIKMYFGDAHSALAPLEDSVRQLKTVGDKFGTAFALRHLSMAATTVDDPRAPDFAAECLALAEIHEATFSKSWGLWITGLEQWKRGDTANAIETIRKSLRLKEQVHDRCGAAHALEILAWAAADTGDMKHAARLFGAADAVWKKVGSSLIECPWFKAFHDLAEQKVRVALGESVFNMIYIEGEHLDEDIASYALEERPCQKKPSPNIGEEDLTGREAEVAELVRQGLSNKEIAAHLVIAPRTAEGHVENILRKLGFTSRVQIATWASEDSDTVAPGHEPR